MSEIRQVICRMNGANYHAPFTDGKRYRAVHYKNALWLVLDDKGLARYVIPDTVSPHLQLQYTKQGIQLSKSVGIFETVEESNESGTIDTSSGNFVSQ